MIALDSYPSPANDGPSGETVFDSQLDGDEDTPVVEADGNVIVLNVPEIVDNAVKRLNELRDSETYFARRSESRQEFMEKDILMASLCHVREQELHEGLTRLMALLIVLDKSSTKAERTLERALRLRGK